MTYKQKTEKLEDILERINNSETPIDKLAEDVSKPTYKQRINQYHTLLKKLTWQKE